MTPTLRVLLASVIDYAGLFPPASLSMPEAVRDFAGSMLGGHGWMLGRFIVPASRLEEFAETAAPRHQPGAAWRVSVLADLGHAESLDAVRRFEQHGSERVIVDSIEFRDPPEIRRAPGSGNGQLAAFYEIPASAEPSLLSRIAATGGRAKIRTGGLSPDMIPSPPDVAGFLARAAAAGLPFKATAGLHHPLRSFHRLTYEPNSPSAKMHGFLNLFLGAAFLKHGMGEAEAVRLIEEEDADAFRFDDTKAHWRDCDMGLDPLRSARREFALSFGSCSFSEPVDDLRALRLL